MQLGNGWNCLVYMSGADASPVTTTAIWISAPDLTLFMRGMVPTGVPFESVGAAR